MRTMKLIDITLREGAVSRAFLDAVRERNGNLPVSLGRGMEEHGEM